jgi:hypothetical protein
MSVSKFTPAELEELRRADAEIDSTDAPLEYELDAELDAIAMAQASGKSVEQLAARKSRQRRYYQEHREERLAYTRKYNADHKEEIARKKHQWYLEHKAECAERSRNYAKSHPETIHKINKKYYENHVKNDPDKQEAIRKCHREYYQKHKAEISQKAKERYRKSKEKESAPSENA